MAEKTKNQAYFRGRVTNKYRQPDGEWLSIVIAVESQNRTTTKDKITDFPRIYWFGSKIDEVDQQIKLHDWVTIQASCRYSSAFHDDIIVGERIAETPREIMQKFGVGNMGPYLDDFNEVQIMGTISNIHIPENRSQKVALVEIRTETEGVSHVTKVSCFRRQYDKVSKMQVGDPVCMIGHIQTSRRERDGRNIRLQSIVCHLIEKIDALPEA